MDSKIICLLFFTLSLIITFGKTSENKENVKEVIQAMEKEGLLDNPDFLLKLLTSLNHTLQNLEMKLAENENVLAEKSLQAESMMQDIQELLVESESHKLQIQKLREYVKEGDTSKKEEL